MPAIFASQTIPYVCQFASPELVADFVHGRRALESDPRWAEYGTVSPTEYAHWALRSCGIVCVKMAVEGLTNLDARPIMDWVRDGQAIDGYLTELRPDRPDKPVEKGWKHAALVDLLQGSGLEARMQAEMTIDDILDCVQNGRAIIASVTSELGEDGPLTRQSGHLVVVYGYAMDERGHVTDIILHNPSGRSAAYQAGARIEAARFMKGFSGRGIIVNQPPITSGS